MVDKIVRDGMVAVAVSRGFGAGWSTWCDVNPLDARFNQLFLEERHDEAEYLADELDLGYAAGAQDVDILWIPVGTKFTIDEYDGSESILTIESIQWYEA